jgi:hypothetical protein
MRLQPGLVMPGGIVPFGSGVIVPPVSSTAFSADASVTAISNGNLNTTSDVLQGREPGLTYRSGLRFPNITVPQGATITSAILTVEQFGSTGSVQPYIGATNTNNAPTLNSSIIIGTPLASPTVLTTTGNGSRNYNITGSVQAVINRAGWASGNSMMICAELVDNGSDLSYNQWRRHDTFTPALRPVLTISY